MKLRWTTPAIEALEAAHNHYHDLNPRAAQRLAERIVKAARQLLDHPEMGRPGLRAGTREWVVTRTPYLLAYRHTTDTIEILQVWHGAQDWTRHAEND